MDKVQLKEYQLFFAERTKTCCRENRIGIMKMLLGNLDVKGIKDVQNIIARMVTRKKFSTEPTKVKLEDDEDGWWEWDDVEQLIDWAGYIGQEVLIGFIKLILINYRRDEMQEIRSSWTYHAREAILYPERPVSRRKSVPGQVGWWFEYVPESIIAVDCEMVPIQIGVRVRKGKIRPRCKNVAATVSVVDFEGNVLNKFRIKQDLSKIHLTEEVKRITGFTKESLKGGDDIADVREKLNQLFQNKLLILIGAGSDFEALGMRKGLYKVFDLHEYYQKDTGNIGLRSLVYHFYKVDIQDGVHDPDIDAKYTMKIFKEKYIPEKLASKDECMIRYSTKMFNEIKTLK